MRIRNSEIWFDDVSKIHVFFFDCSNWEKFVEKNCETNWWNYLMNSLQDMNGKELLRFDRPLKCMECPCDGCYPNWTQVRKCQEISKWNWGVFNSPPKNNEKTPLISALASTKQSGQNRHFIIVIRGYLI